VVLSALSTLSACASSASPVTAPVPASVGRGDCTIGDGGSGALVTVDPAPRSVTAVWLPGLNHACTPVISHGGAQVASRLADDVRNARPAPSGAIACPEDSGAGVRLYFSYPSTHLAEVVDVALTGCEFVAAPGRSARATAPPLHRDLRPMAPQAWLSYLSH